MSWNDSDNVALSECRISLIVTSTLLFLSLLVIAYLLGERFQICAICGSSNKSCASSKELKMVIVDAIEQPQTCVQSPKKEASHQPALKYQTQIQPRETIRSRLNLQPKHASLLFHTANPPVTRSPSYQSLSSNNSNVSLGRRLLESAPNDEKRALQTLPNITFQQYDLSLLEAARNRQSPHERLSDRVVHKLWISNTRGRHNRIKNL